MFRTRLLTSSLVALLLLSACPEQVVDMADDAEYHYKLANNFFYDKNVPSALQELYRTIELDAKHAKAHHLLGFIYFGRKEYARSLKHQKKGNT